MKLSDWIYGKRARAAWLAKQITERFPQGSTILNVGAGQGSLEKELATSGFQISSLEPFPQKEFLNVLKEELETATFLGKFNLVVFSYSLHHFANTAAALAKAVSLLEPQGKIFVLDIAPRSTFLRTILMDTGLLCFKRKQSWTQGELIAIAEKTCRVEIIVPYLPHASLFILSHA